MPPSKPVESRALRKRHTTLSDVARLAGVAPMTVSRVVNGNGYVSTELRRRIEKAVESLNYSPNQLARSLKGTPTNVVGVLLPDLSNPFSAEVARGIEETLAERGYYAFVISADPVSQRENAAIQAFSDHRVEGVILATRSSRLDPADISKLARERFPVVIVGPEFKGEYVNHVAADYRDGGFRATSHLIGLGRRRIAFLGSDAREELPLLRFQGYLDALKENGLSGDPALTAAPARRVTWCTQHDGYECMNRLLNGGKPPDAVFARNDFAAFGALHAMNERGIRVPDDIALVGFDNVSLGAYASPPLTTIEQFAFDQGRTAGAMVLDRIEGKQSSTGREQLFPCELVIRKSSR